MDEIVTDDWDAPRPPSASKLLRRMEGPAPFFQVDAVESLGVESVGAEGDARPVSPAPAAPTGGPDAKDRLAAAEALLKRLAETTAEVDEADVDRMIRDAEEAMRKLASEGGETQLTSDEAFATEAVIEADGSRPVLFVQDGTIDIEVPDLNEGNGRLWKEPVRWLLPGIRKVAASVGAVQLPAFLGEDGLPKRIGTAFAIGNGFVLTNRHVLEEIAQKTAEGWAFKFAVEVDFAGEYQRKATRAFKVKGVGRTGPNPINRTINFANLDFAILELDAADAAFPVPLTLGGNATLSLVGARQPQIYVMGFPAQPLEEESGDVRTPPAAGHEYAEILEKLFRGRFGSKRCAPGLIEAGPGQLLADARQWVMSHDASTLGGNSGSCVVDFQQDGASVLGLHFGGRARVENWAHVLAALRAEIGEIAGMRWSQETPVA